MATTYLWLMDVKPLAARRHLQFMPGLPNAHTLRATKGIPVFMISDLQDSL